MTYLLLLVAYLLGGIAFGYVLVRLKTGQDVRAMGSGNIGATNVARTSGKLIGIGTLALDIGKGWLAVWLMARFGSGEPMFLALAGLAVILGHAFPVFLKFAGGKAVASFVGAFFYLAPLPMLAITIVFLAIVWRTRYVSLGSILGAALVPFAIWMIDHSSPWIWGAALVGGWFIIWRHRGNITRLRAGTENKL
ncbi:MAG: glycerol-3-phosphate 1-O-acyltransferase PlsY [Acidobacteria bacterium]|nr:glycerol-3-phosphate 1-O-acyltransferase PlsY [Acidobacteriota bacterium]